MLQKPNYRQNHRMDLGLGVYPDKILGNIDNTVCQCERDRFVDRRAERYLIKGVPAAPGVAVGSAVVIQTPEDLQRVRPDSILICSRMSPEYSIAFSMVRGIISERGGTMSASTTIARENGLPVLTGVQSARHIICDGDLVRIDGKEGHVHIILKG